MFSLTVDHYVISFSIYEKLIEYCQIDEKGTNFPPVSVIFVFYLKKQKQIMPNTQACKVFIHPSIQPPIHPPINPSIHPQEVKNFKQLYLDVKIFVIKLKA